MESGFFLLHLLCLEDHVLGIYCSFGLWVGKHHSTAGFIDAKMEKVSANAKAKRAKYPHTIYNYNPKSHLTFHSLYLSPTSHAKRRALYLNIENDSNNL